MGYVEFWAIVNKTANEDSLLDVVNTMYYVCVHVCVCMCVCVCVHVCTYIL